jgi:two-component system, chemotaxis family, sensor kinase CheA
MDVKAEYRAAFGEEAGENLSEWERSLLALECRPGDAEQVNGLFRAIHTLKGSAGFLGFDGLARVAHALESRLADVRDGVRTLDQPQLDGLFAALDLCRTLVGDFADGRPASVDAAEFLRQLPDLPCATATIPASPAAATKVPSEPTPSAAAPSAGPGVGCQPGERMVPVGLHIDGASREAWLRSLLVKARLERLGRISSVTPSPEELRDGGGRFAYTLVLATSQDDAAIRDALTLDQVDVTSLGDGTAREPAASQASSGAAIPAAPSEHAAEVVRVSVEKLDTLLNLVGELVIQNSGFAVVADTLRGELGRSPIVADFEQRTGSLARTVRELQDGIMKARMLPVSSVFDRFHRVVRDLAKIGGKAVTLEVRGEETEIDKKVIDRIGEPLVHLVRNAVDHGLETAAERTAAGKPAEGRVRLGAYQEGDRICIEVADDGRGLDRAAIARKAIEKGLISETDAAAASDDRVLSFIFLPGFSTARKVSDISGRGVGMDVVRRVVEDMGGGVRVHSTPGAGTTVTIALPLTMSIISAVLVEVDGSLFAIPLSSVREIVKSSSSLVVTVGTRRVVHLREEVFTLAHLGRILRGEPDTDGGPGSEGYPIVVVDNDGRTVGLAVDRIEGTREIVIKSLGRHFREIEGLIGASILGSGRIALIVDVESLIGLCRTDAGEGFAPEPRFTVQELAPADAPTEAAPSENAPTEAAETAPDSDARTDASDSVPASPLDEAAERLLHAQGTLLEEIHNSGAIQASLSLSELTGSEIRVSFPESRLAPLGDVSGGLGGPESVVGGVYVGVTGDLDAGILLVVPRVPLLALDDLLHRRPAGTTERIEDADQSALGEAANLVAAAFVNAMAAAAGLRLGMLVPEITVDMCQAVLDSVLARFDRAGDQVLLTQAVIQWGAGTPMGCDLLVLLEPASLERLVAALQAGVGAGA